MTYHLVRDNVIVASGNKNILDRLIILDKVNHPTSIFNHLSEDKLRSLGIYRETLDDVSKNYITDDYYTVSSTVSYDVESDNVIRVKVKTPRSVADCKSILKRKVNSIRDEKLQTGFIVPMGNTYTTIQTASTQDLINILGISVAALSSIVTSSNSSFEFRDSTNTDHNLSDQEALVMGLGALNRASEIYKRSWTLKEAVESKRQINTLKAVDLTDGWE
jgi:hypothetical protein